MDIKLGRKPRIYGAVPHLSMMRRALHLGAPTVEPVPVDYMQSLASANAGNVVWGQMLNNQEGDCTCAAVYHRRQLVSGLTNPPIDTQPDSIVQQLYAVWNPPPKDEGCIEQEVLSYWRDTGIPLSDGSVNKLVTFIEIDPHNAIDVDWAITDCLGVYIGFNVPGYIVDFYTQPGSTWDLPSNGNEQQNAGIVGGHAVYVAAHATNGNRGCISWGALYTMTRAFWLANVDEVYAIVDTDLIAAKTGQSILGMTAEQIQSAATQLGQ